MKLRSHLQRRIFRDRVRRNLAKLRERQEIRKGLGIKPEPRKVSQLDKSTWEKLLGYWWPKKKAVADD